MPYRLLADGLLITHLLFILFVLLGGLLLFRDRRWAILHLPAILWGATIEFQGWICPLTPWENQLRTAAGQRGYAGGFIEHYLLAMIYPPGLTPSVQTLLGGLVIGINLVIYGLVIKRWRQRSRPGGA
jgi:hypothetical protein